MYSFREFSLMYIQTPNLNMTLCLTFFRNISSFYEPKEILFPKLLSPQIQQLSKKEIEDLLRRGAYGAIMEEEDEGSKFCEEDIDQILLRRTKTITIESEGRGSTFAKVTIWGG